MRLVRAVLFSLAVAAAALAQGDKPRVETPSVDRQKAKPQPSAAQIENGESLFLGKCAFCHGRDAGGGETGPDLTQSTLVATDTAGDKIGPVVRNGRPEKGMPRFSFSDADLASVVAFIHDRKTKSESQVGGRRGVDDADLQSGDAEAGKRYFAGAGGCASCHSPTGDLAGVGTRYHGLKLEERLLYPQHAPEKAIVTLPSGETVSGVLAYRDEFVVALRDPSGRYRSWFAKDVKYKVDAPADAHAELLNKYTDSDIHNLMAYLQTLR